RELVLPERRAGKQRGRGEDRLREPRTEEWDADRERVRHHYDLAFLDLGRGGLGDRGGDTVGRTGLIVRPPRRRRNDLGTVGLGQRQRRRCGDEQGSGEQALELHATHSFRRRKGDVTGTSMARILCRLRGIFKGIAPAPERRVT